jgi:hypothetical protein
VTDLIHLEKLSGAYFLGPDFIGIMILSIIGGLIGGYILVFRMERRYRHKSFAYGIINSGLLFIMFYVLIGVIGLFLMDLVYFSMQMDLIPAAQKSFDNVWFNVATPSSINKGLVKNNCITCFFRIEEIIKSRQIYYEEKYGFIPGFRAGLHLGQATVGEIGVIKKDIVYSGDVLNTTSRIQNECRVHDVNLLVSSAVLQQLPASEKYKSEPIGEIQLRGKIDTVMLNAVNTTIY